MLSTLDIVHDLPRSRQRHRSLWHDASQYSPLLGCTICPDRKLCGGLQVEMPMFNCLGLCCGHPETCDSVCRNHPEGFARRIWEIGGFSFDNVPRAPVLDEPKLPRLVPLFFDGSHPLKGPASTELDISLMEGRLVPKDYLVSVYGYLPRIGSALGYQIQFSCRV
jgi:hypothetical protein